MPVSILLGIIICIIAIVSGIIALLYTTVGLIQSYVLGGHRKAAVRHVNARKHEKRAMREETGDAIRRALTIAFHGG